MLRSQSTIFEKTKGGPTIFEYSSKIMKVILANQFFINKFWITQNFEIGPYATVKKIDEIFLELLTTVQNRRPNMI